MHSSSGIRSKRYSADSLLGATLLLLTAFPYLQFIPSDSYTQPFALFLGTLLFLFQGRRVYFSLRVSDQIALLGLAVIGVGFFLLTCFPYSQPQEYKYLVSYLSPLLLTIPLLRYLSHHHAAALRVLQFSILLWIIIAITQKFFDPTFLGFVIGHWSESSLDIVESGRGVLGLAPEPTHHAFHILLLAAALALLDSSNWSRTLLAFCIADAVLLAASSSAILVLGISGVIWSLIYKQRWIFLLAILALTIWTVGFSEQESFGSDLRVGQLFHLIMADPTSVLAVDYSLNVRIGGMIAVLSEVFGSALIPFGMSLQSWGTARDTLLTELPWLMDLSSVGPPSGIGQLLFQAGAFGAVFICLMFRRILNSCTSNLGRILLIASPLVFLSQYYISAPTFALLYACALFRLMNKSEIKISNLNPSRILAST